MHQAEQTSTDNGGYYCKPTMCLHTLSLTHQNYHGIIKIKGTLPGNKKRGTIPGATKSQKSVYNNIKSILKEICSSSTNISFWLN